MNHTAPLRPARLVASAAALSALLMLTHCSDEFSACRETDTCGGNDGGGGSAAGDGASAGAPAVSDGGAEGGVAGAAGSETQPRCESDEDCSDALLCNGRERCEGGECVAGEFPCGESTNEGCEAVCLEFPGAFDCVEQGRDEDGDGFLAAACALDPGEDCDDSDAEVHPGAVERCDGIDNDCNGARDVEDGLPLVAETSEIGESDEERAAADVAWVPDLSAFAFAWMEGVTRLRVYVETTDARGVVQRPTFPIEREAVFYEMQQVSVAARGSHVGVAWRSTADAYFKLLKLEIDDTLNLAAGVEQVGIGVTSNLRTASFGSGEWVVAAQLGEALVLARLRADVGSVNKRATVSETASTFLALAGSSPDVLLLHGTSGSSQVVRVDHDLKLSAGIPVGSASSGSMAADESRFAVYSTVDSAQRLVVYDADGETRCNVEFGTSRRVSYTLLRLQHGWLLLDSKLVGRIVYDDCALGPAFPLVDAVNASSVRGARGPSGYAIAWYDVDNERPMRTFLPPLLCEAED